MNIWTINLQTIEQKKITTSASHPIWLARQFLVKSRTKLEILKLILFQEQQKKNKCCYDVHFRRKPNNRLKFFFGERCAVELTKNVQVNEKEKAE